MNNELISIISDAQSSDFIQFINQVGFIDFKSINHLVFHDLPSLKDKDAQKTILTAGKGKLFSLEGNFTEALACLNDAYNLAIHSWGKKADNDKDDVLAYVLYEFGLFNSKLKEFEKARTQFNNAIVYAESVKLQSLLEYSIETLNSKQLSYSSIGELKKKVDSLKSHKIYSTYCVGLLQIGNYYVLGKQYSQAKQFYKLAQSNAKKHKLKYVTDSAINALGYLHLVEKNYDQAIKLFNEVISTTDSNYLRSIAMENIGAIHYYSHEYKQAIDVFIESLQNSTDNNVLSQIPSVCSLLGRIYSEKLNNPTKAKYFYKLGFENSMSQIQLGLSLSGSRESSIKQYNQFLTKIGYKHIEAVEEAKIDDTVFSFAIDKKWLEIRDLFQYNLLMYHRSKHSKLDAVISSMKIIKPTYYSNQNKLTKKGFEFPYMKKVVKVSLSSVNNILPELQKYINELSDKTWLGANDRFEKDLFKFLYHNYGYMKTNLAEKLGISYLTVRKKTEHVSRRKG